LGNKVFSKVMFGNSHPGTQVLLFKGDVDVATFAIPKSFTIYELTAGKDSDKEAKVSKGDQALTDNSKSKDKESDKNTTVLKKEETKAPETTEAPKKEEAKPQEKPAEKVPEKLPEAGFETIGAGLLGASFIGAGVVAVAKRKAKRQ